MSDDKIINLNLPQADRSNQTLTLVRESKCQHHRFKVDEEKAMVECRDCGLNMNPMAVLGIMARGETRWNNSYQRAREEQKRLAERSKTKCRHCGSITPISRN